MFLGWEVQRWKVTIIINVSCQNLFTINDLVYIYYINLVESIIRYQNLHLAYKELRKFWMADESFIKELLKNSRSKTAQTHFEIIEAFAARFLNCVWPV